jgi:ABC-type Na+ efflux pump permease subunit
VNWRAIWAIVRKDLKVVMQNKGVTIPIILLPVILFVLLPALALFVPALFVLPGNQGQDMLDWAATMPEALQSSLAGYTPEQQTIFLFLVYLLAPLYLIVPMMVASVVAADSFAGEKERKTLEALLYTPTTDQELLVAKMLAAWLPAVAVAWIGFLLYAIVVNLSSWPVMESIFFPNTMWLLLALWVAPAVAGLGLASMVLVSVRAQGFQDAYQLGALVVLPIVILVIGQASGVLFFSTELVLLLGLLVWVVDLLLVLWGSRTFKRAELIARL